VREKQSLAWNIQYAALAVRLAGPTDIEILLVSSSRGRWIIPKGWPKVGEGAEAAAREAFEEGGITGRLVEEPLGRFDYIKRVPGRVARHHVIVHLLVVSTQHPKWPERPKRNRLWATPEEVFALIEDPDLRSFLRRLDWQEIQRQAQKLKEGPHRLPARASKRR
jgi:8-oxo-dGTP pyrophosphatase MutT (NUDIX family)